MQVTLVRKQIEVDVSTSFEARNCTRTSNSKKKINNFNSTMTNATVFSNPPINIKNSPLAILEKKIKLKG